MKANEHILKLATVLPYSFLIVEEIYTKCRLVYYPENKAFEKCYDIMKSASELNITPLDAFDLQFQIDFVLL